MLKRKPRNIEKETNAVALLEEVSVLQKERFEIANADSAKSNSLVGLKNLENQISSMWGKVITDSVPADISTALEHLEKQMVENKTELEKLKETQQQLEDEIEHLKEDISRFDGSAEIKEDENACEVIKVVKQLRRNLNKKIKEENESQEQSTHKLQQCVNELWTSASCNMDDMASKDVCDDGRGPSTWQMLKEVTTAFKEFKDTSLEVEKVSFSIYKGLLDAESQVENSSESKTPTSVLKGALHRLQQSKTEMINFVKEFRELKLAMSLEQVDKASTENCKLITEKVKRLKEDNKFMESLLEESQEILTQTYSELIGEPYLFSEPNTNMKAIIGRYPEWLHGVVSVISNVRNCVAENKKSFEQRFVSVKKYESLKDKEKELNAEKEQLALRLSKVAGARLTDNNPNIADLSDPNRPTKIAEQYSELYDNEWTEAFEDIKSGNEPSKIYTLLQIIVGTYNMCDEISQNHQSVLKRVILRPAEGLEIKKDLKKGQKREEKKPESLQFSAVQSKTLSELRKQTAELSVEEVKKHIRESHEEWFKSKNLEKYTAMCIELCWLMHVQSPPVFMETNVKPGSSFDTNRYKEYTKKGKKTDFLVWPALFLHEGGSVLAKGVAQGK